VAKAEPAPAKAPDAARAQALLEGKAAQAEGRFVVQVGAFADVAKARETRLKVEKAGLKTYTHVAETKDGKRIRVRVGPFATRAEADKAAHRIKELDLPAAILTL
jgi:DedD protein